MLTASLNKPLVGRKKIKPILVNTNIFYYKNIIYLYKMLHVSTFNGHRQARINEMGVKYLELLFYERYLFLISEFKSKPKLFLLRLFTVIILLYKNQPDTP